MGTTDAPPTRNADGRFFITEECDGCGLCGDAARYFVIRQPVDGSEEEALLRDAMEQCPLSCIRDDGTVI